ncbi:hypothetical protein V1264_016640 [Littorina saxatilis]|uniref:DUF6729 domain-containing protein n=1 Tax=Littorina saxatilis TaxID=31220 RepID=A0AAN9BHX7_9CAEN
MRQRTLGNGPTQLMKTVREQHQERWMRRGMMYAGVQEQFLKARAAGLATSSPHEEPPALPAVYSVQWLQEVYCQDVAQRLTGVQAAITSTFGSVLKMDSTKKITKKLAGRSAGTAAWTTNVGNQHGQVLMCVLTTHEGSGLQQMMEGVRRRYREAEVTPPVLLYVDRDCCNGRTAQMLQAEWTNTLVRLDNWHFMRRLAAGVTT